MAAPYMLPLGSERPSAASSPERQAQEAREVSGGTTKAALSTCRPHSAKKPLLVEWKDTSCVRATVSAAAASPRAAASRSLPSARLNDANLAPP